MIPSCFACYSKNKKVVENSSSGGVFYSIASEIIEIYNGAVYGAAFINGKVVHIRITQLADIPFLMGSKYVKSDLKNVFAETEKDLLDEKRVFFTGTPCQVYALKFYLEYRKIPTENLITADIVCKGVSKFDFWKQYLIENFGDKNINSVNFRLKKPSWEDYSIMVDGKVESKNNNLFMVGYLNNFLLEEACYNCKFKGEKRASDFTIGDFWCCKDIYPNLYNKKGTSLLIIRKNEDFLLNILKKTCVLEKTSYCLSLFFNTAYYKSTIKPNNLSLFRELYAKKGFNYSVKTIVLKKKKLRQSVRNRISKIYFCLKKRINYKKLKNKIGIVTDFGYSNYGNRLQNYALRVFLEKNGYKTINIKYDKMSSSKFFPVYNFFRKLKCFKRIPRYKNLFDASIRSGEENLYLTYSEENMNGLNNLHSIIYGSDQIWNWTYHTSDLPLMLNVGTPSSLNRFSYAASFGIDYIPQELFYFYYEGLSSLNDIGVREESGYKIMKDMNLIPHINLDPTFLLEKSEWEKAISKFSCKNIDKDYIFIYILGKNNKNEIFDYIEKGSNIIDGLATENYQTFNHFDFINKIRNADLIITDSFHACVFSIIFEKTIILIKRDGMDSRLNTLFGLISLPLVYGEKIELKGRYQLIDKNVSKNYLLENLRRKI